MRVALLIDTLAGGGSEGVVRRLALGLARRGHRVFVYCLKTAGIPVDRLQAAGVVVREAQSLGHDVLLAWRLARWLRSDRVEIAHAHSCAALAWVFPAARLRGVPLVHVRHGWPLGRAGRYGRLANRLDCFVDCVAINCESGRAKLPRGAVARRAARVPNGVDCEPVAPQAARRLLEELCGQPLPGPVVLSVANIRVEKGIRELLGAFARLRRKWPDATLVCVGGVIDAAYWAKVRQDLHRLHLDRGVYFPGHFDDAHRLMAGADVFCLSSRAEAMPNVVLEAMAQRAPLVAAAVGDIGQLGPRGGAEHFLLRHKHTALLVPPGAPAALAEALDCVLNDRPAAEQRASRAANVYARRFTTEHMVRRYERLYGACLRRRGEQPSAADLLAARRGFIPHPPPSRSTEKVFRRRKRPAVLMLGPGPPQIGGMVTSINLLMNSPLRKRYELHRFAATLSPETVDKGRRRTRTRLAALARHGAALSRLAGVLLDKRITLLHIHTCSYFTYYRNLLDLAVAKLLGRKVVVHIRGNLFERFCAGSGPLGRWLIRRGLEWADAVIVLSRSWYHALRPYFGGARVFVIPNAFDPDVVAAPQRSPGAHSDRPDQGARPPCRFLFLGAVTESKGVGDLLEAARLLRRGGTSFELCIAGPAAPDERRRWERYVRDARLADVVQFAGPVTGRAKARLLAWADCFVHPSHSEGLPNAVLEGAAAGLPVIATTVGATPEVMTPPETGGGADTPGFITPLVPPHAPAALACEMSRLAADPELRHAIVGRLRAHVTANYSLERKARRVARLYEELLLPARRGRHERAEIDGVIDPPALVLAERSTPQIASRRPRPADSNPAFAQT